MSNKEFVGFVKVKEVQYQGGSFEYTQISFKEADLEKMKGRMNEKGYVNLKLNRSQKGNEYLEIDTFGLNQQESAPAPPISQAPAPVMPAAMPPIGDDSQEVPF